MFCHLHTSLRDTERSRICSAALCSHRPKATAHRKFSHRCTTLLPTCLKRFIVAILSSQLANATATWQQIHRRTIRCEMFRCRANLLCCSCQHRQALDIACPLHCLTTFEVTLRIRLSSRIESSQALNAALMLRFNHLAAIRLHTLVRRISWRHWSTAAAAVFSTHRFTTLCATSRRARCI